MENEDDDKKKSNKSFFVRKGNKHIFNKYEDLYGKTIGVIRGKRFFKRFNHDKKIKKYIVNNFNSSVSALTQKRADAFIATDSEGHYQIKILNLQNKIEEANYKYNKINEVWLTLSKKSLHKDRLHQITKIFKEMHDSSQIDKIISNWFTSKGLETPEYK